MLLNFTLLQSHVWIEVSFELNLQPCLLALISLLNNFEVFKVTKGQFSFLGFLEIELSCNVSTFHKRGEKVAIK